MREKFANSAWFLGSSPLVHSWFRILMMSVFLGILIVWGIDGLNTGSFQSDYLVLKLNSTQTLPFKDFSFRNLSVDMEDREKIDLNLTNQILAKSDGNPHLESSSQPLNLVENETHIVSSWSPYVLENATKIGNERNTSSPRILGDTLKLGESSRLYRLDWVPISFAYNINDSFVPQMDSLDSVEEETEGTTDQIVPAVTELLVAQFMWLDYDGPTKPIYLYINSSSTQNEKRETVGSETEAYAIADTMAYCKADVYTVNCGMAYGQAAMLLSLGAKGFRGLQPNCSSF